MPTAGGLDASSITMPAYRRRRRAAGRASSSCPPTYGRKALRPYGGQVLASRAELEHWVRERRRGVRAGLYIERNPKNRYPDFPLDLYSVLC